ncbi:MAG TPA: TRAP transporter small permease [Burkholderiales bacterium]|jgi:TRAP-type C4-dicarboxylate transport system permease small subunit
MQSATRWLALGACACLLAIALGTLADVTGRWLFGAPIRGYNDFAALAIAVVCAAFFPALIAQRGNVTVRLVGLLLGRRASRALDTFGALVTFVFFAVMAWQYVRYAAEMARAGERTAILRWEVWPFWWAVALCIAATALVAVMMIFKKD